MHGLFRSGGDIVTEREIRSWYWWSGVPEEPCPKATMDLNLFLFKMGVEIELGIALAFCAYFVCVFVVLLHHGVTRLGQVLGSQCEDNMTVWDIES